MRRATWIFALLIVVLGSTVVQAAWVYPPNRITAVYPHHYPAYAAPVYAYYPSSVYGAQAVVAPAPAVVPSVPVVVPSPAVVVPGAVVYPGYGVRRLRVYYP
jgi:hypothetical protein